MKIVNYVCAALLCGWFGVPVRSSGSSKPSS